jgi:hypothetical protein
MAALRRGGFVGDDTLSVEPRAEGEIVLAGEIACLGRIVVDVFKVLEVLEGEGADAMVQTLFYSYNVFLRGGNNILRYDNLHPRKDHPDDHHKHTYSWKTGEQLPGSPVWIGAEKWPTLGEVLREVQSWYYEHREQLERAEEFPSLGARGK